MRLSDPILHLQFGGLVKSLKYFILVIPFSLATIQSFCQQDTRLNFPFGFHQGFYFAEQKLDACKSYFDTTTRILFNPCIGFAFHGIYPYVMAQKAYLDGLPSSDTFLVIRQGPVLSQKELDILHKQQQQIWEQFYIIWEDQKKYERYYVDLEGIIKGVKTKAP